LLSGAGCGEKEGDFRSAVIGIKGKEIRVELALTAEARFRGLKFRRELGKDAGMLFVFPRDVRHPFWMKETFLPLSIAFLDREGRIIRIAEMEPLNENKLYHSPRPYRYALEMNQEWFDRNGVEAGDMISLNGRLTSAAR